jgi:phosphopantothenoylcysteine synthetase/decarboxylase
MPRMTSTSAPRFLVTAGNTRERIDAVRDWGNIFTGNTGLAIARALSTAGAVDLLTSNPAHLASLSSEPQRTPHPIRATDFVSHAELKGALAALMGREHYAAVFMTAAVADYQPAGVYEVIERRPDPAAAAASSEQELWVVRSVQAAKVRSTYGTIAVAGRPTEKIVDLFRSAWGFKGLLVKFKLEVGIAPQQLVQIGEQSRRASGADYLVANTLDMVGGASAGAYLLGQDAPPEWVPRNALPQRMLELVQHTLRHGGGGS